MFKKQKKRKHSILLLVMFLMMWVIISAKDFSSDPSGMFTSIMGWLNNVILGLQAVAVVVGVIMVIVKAIQSFQQHDPSGIFMILITVAVVVAVVVGAPAIVKAMSGGAVFSSIELIQ